MALEGFYSVLRAGKRAVYTFFSDKYFPEKAQPGAKFPFGRGERIRIVYINELVEEYYVYVFHCIQRLKSRRPLIYKPGTGLKL